jgi:hypothetical protein
MTKTKTKTEPIDLPGAPTPELGADPELGVVRGAIARRPTEAATGLGLAAAIYGFLTQAGLEPGLAAVLAVVVAFVPAGISGVVEAVRGG